jgi:uncharacterized protein YdeI (YjbR/CyaY-like superfamily)
MNNMNPKVNWFFEKDSKWQEAYKQLRRIVLDCGLVEELKWGKPCYTFQGSNIVLMHGFKEYCALLFPKGVLLEDFGNILIQQTKNTQSARQIRFTDVQEVIDQETVLKAYIDEAIEVEKAGLEVPMKKTEDFNVPEEFQAKLDESPALKEAFENLTPGRQRGYLLHFSDAKQSKTRKRRVEKYIPKILNGEGMRD